MVGLYKQIRDGYSKILSVYGQHGCPAQARALTEPLKPEEIRASQLNTDLLSMALGAMRGADGEKIKASVLEYLAMVYCLERHALSVFSASKDQRLLVMARLCAWIRSCGQERRPLGYLDGGGLSHLLSAMQMYPVESTLVTKTTYLQGLGLQDHLPLPSVMGNYGWVTDPLLLLSLLHPFVYPLEVTQTREAMNSGLQTWVGAWDWTIENLYSLGFDPLAIPGAPSADPTKITEHWFGEAVPGTQITSIPERKRAGSGRLYIRAKNVLVERPNGSVHLVVPDDKEGSYYLDASEAFPVPAQNGDGFWEVDQARGVVVPSPRPGSAPWHLYATSVRMPGAHGKYSFMQAVIGPVGSDLKDISGAGMDFTGAFFDPDMRYIDFSGAALRGAVIKRAERCSFVGANMQGAWFCDLDGSRMMGADLSRTLRCHRSYIGGELDGINLSKSRPVDPNARGSIHVGSPNTSAKNANFQHFVGALQLRSALSKDLLADFSGSDFSDAVLAYSDLRHANLQNTNLRGTDFSWAQLGHTKFRGAKIDERTNFEHAHRLPSNPMIPGWEIFGKGSHATMRRGRNPLTPLPNPRCVLPDPAASSEADPDRRLWVLMNNASPRRMVYAIWCLWERAQSLTTDEELQALPQELYRLLVIDGLASTVEYVCGGDSYGMRSIARRAEYVAAENRRMVERAKQGLETPGPILSTRMHEQFELFGAIGDVLNGNHFRGIEHAMLKMDLPFMQDPAEIDMRKKIVTLALTT